MNDLKTPMAALATGLMLLGVSTPITAQVQAEGTILPTKVHWGYQAQIGPKYWASMANEFALCGSGKRQSPIDLEPEITQDAQLYSLTFNYRDVGLNVLNNGHTLQANYNSAGITNSVTIDGKSIEVAGHKKYDSYLMIGDDKYQLLQFHFHTPSEHEQSRDQNPTLQKILNNVSDQKSQVNRVPEIKINASELLPPQQSLFHYSGSLTTPPCSENVNWYVMSQPMQISTQQVNDFRKLVG